MDEELKYTIALSCIKGIGPIRARMLIEAFGSAKSTFDADNHSLLQLAKTGQLIIEQRNNTVLMDRAEHEIGFCQDHHIQILKYGGAGYPSRLLECPDAPALLYYIGKGNLESKHTIGIVGTRNCSQYGRDMVSQLISDLKDAVPDLVINSGLALGIDISAHRAALFNGIPTIGVVAHGLDRIYPSAHRNDASRMIEQGGGIITEYITGSDPERGNFLARNRIIAGLSDAIVVAESKDKGGSLVTAAIANDYNKEVLAFPGRCNDERSKGCNRLIRTNRATLITNAHDLLEVLGWDTPPKEPHAIQQSIPFEEEKLSPTERLITDILKERGDMRLTQLADITNLDHSILLETLLDLEMEDKVRNCAGGIYQLK